MNTLIPFLRRGSFNNLVYDFDRMFDFNVDEEKSFVLHGDVEETESEIHMTFDVPGMKENDYSVTVHDNQLIISGERKKEITSEKENGGYRYYGRQYGKFQRIFSLPTSVDQSKIDAHYEAGVLSVTLPKHEEQKPKSIEVKVKRNE